MKTIGDRIKHLRTIAGISQEEFARTIPGVTRGAVGNWELGKPISRENVKAIASRWAVSIDWLENGAGPGPDDIEAPSSIRIQPDPQSGRPITLKRIPDLAIYAGMGNGGLLSVSVDQDGMPTDPDQVMGYWTFPDYITERIRNFSKVYAFSVTGDSMAPTIPGGSVVFVDTSQNRVPPEDVYAIDYGDGLMVKRLKLVPRSDSVTVISDNERYGSDDLLRDDVHVYGRVIGWFQWRG